MSSAITIQASEHPLKSVTVFKSAKAEVVRTFLLDLKQGQNKIEIRGLPSVIDTRSVRVSGLGMARLFDVVCTIAKKDLDEGPDSSAEVTRKLKAQRVALESQKAFREQEYKFAVAYGQSLTAQHVNPSDMNNFLAKYREQGLKMIEEVNVLDEKIIAVDRKIDAINEPASLKRGAALGKINIIIVVGYTDTRACSCETAPTIDKTQGRVASVTLSAAARPPLSSLPPPPPSRLRGSTAASASTHSYADVPASRSSWDELSDLYSDIDAPLIATYPTTIVSETPMAISFSVHGQSTIPSDGIEHQVSVAVLPFDSKISYVTVPRLEPRVHLQCQVKNTSEYRLLPGPVSVILDDSYVSKTSIVDVNTGDYFDCTLGHDASTKVTYARSSHTAKSTGGAFSEVFNTTTYTAKISIHNKHQFPLSDLVVREVIPTSDDKLAKIILRKPAGLADVKDGQTVDMKNDGLVVGWEKVVDGKGGEKEGRFEWKWKVGSGEKVTLEAEWEVKVPGDMTWVETFGGA